MARHRDAADRYRIAPRGSSPKGLAAFAFSPLRPDDVGRISEIEKLCFRYPWSRQSFEEVVQSRTFGTIAARDRGDTVIGYIIFSEVVDELHVLNVAVHPEYRRRGIATALLTSLHKMALERGRAFAYLEVRESNKAAQALYLKFGYKPLTKRKAYYSDNHEDAVIMTAPLKKRFFSR